MPDLMETPPTVQNIEPEVLSMQPSENASSTTSPISEDARQTEQAVIVAHLHRGGLQSEQSSLERLGELVRRVTSVPKREIDTA